MSDSFEGAVSRAVQSGIYIQVYEDIGLPEDSNVNGSPEGGRLWIRLRDGRQITVTYQIKVDLPSQDAQTEIM